MNTRTAEQQRADALRQWLRDVGALCLWQQRAQLYTLAPMIHGDWRDAYLMALYARLSPKLNTRARIALLSGIAGFNRSYPLDD